MLAALFGTACGGARRTRKPAARAPGPANPARNRRALVCSLGVNLAGNVRFEGKDLPHPTGEGAFGDPPVNFWNTAFVGEVLHASTLHELWTLDLGSPKPTFVRYAGVDPSAEKDQAKWQDGACAQARFPQIDGITTAPDGSLFVTDDLAHGIMHITSPGTAECAAHVYAGNAAAAHVDPIGLASGAKDGPGKAASFAEPMSPVTDGEGNLYVLDNHNKIRKIAADAAHTVTTVVTLPITQGASYRNLTFMNGKLYTIYLEPTANSFIEVDLAGTTRTVYRGDNTKQSFSPVDSSTLPVFGALTNDGTRLLAYGSGYIWSLTPTGTLAVIAGTTRPLAYPSDYDWRKPHHMTDLLLPAGFRNLDMTFHKGAIYFHGTESYYDISYLTKISCP